MNQSQPRSHLDQPTYWFAVLDMARERGDSDRVQEALRNLKRLGVKVTFKKQKGDT